MAAQSYDEVLRQAQELSPSERQQLIGALTAEPMQNGENEKKVKTLGDCFRERGLVGIVKDGPPDLSTNPKYMEGFGEDDDQ